MVHSWKINRFWFLCASLPIPETYTLVFILITVVAPYFIKVWNFKKLNCSLFLPGIYKITTFQIFHGSNDISKDSWFLNLVTRWYYIQIIKILEFFVQSDFSTNWFSLNLFNYLPCAMFPLKNIASHIFSFTYRIQYLYTV